MIPFVVDMARLFELFVAEWLRAHLPPSLELKAQHTHEIDPSLSLRFQIDLVLTDATTEAAWCVLDTKYKDSRVVAADDIAQVVAYATAKGCCQAVLIYPKNVLPPEVHVGAIRVRALPFSLQGDLDEAGRQLLDQVLSPEFAVAL